MAESKGGDRSPSSMDSSAHPALSTTTLSACRLARGDLSTDLRLGLSLSSSSLQAADESIPSTPWGGSTLKPVGEVFTANLYGHGFLALSQYFFWVRPDQFDHYRYSKRIYGRNQEFYNWPPIKPFLRSAPAASATTRRQRRALFVKVYMEGVPIGRKLDLLLLDGYDSLLVKLCHMFQTPITYADVCHHQVPGVKAAHFLTYEDQEGDWMMLGDVPWELFLTSVKKLRIARTDKYYSLPS